MSRMPNALLGLGLVAVLTTAACSSAPSTAAPPAAGPSSTIPQPTPPAGFPVGPESSRVDVMRPTFTNPTQVTNPLFPVSAQASVLQLGTVDGEPLRTEVTTLPYTRFIAWDGQPIEVLVSQYVLFAGGRNERVLTVMLAGESGCRA